MTQNYVENTTLTAAKSSNKMRTIDEIYKPSEINKNTHSNLLICNNRSKSSANIVHNKKQSLNKYSYNRKSAVTISNKQLANISRNVNLKPSQRYGGNGQAVVVSNSNSMSAIKRGSLKGSNEKSLKKLSKNGTQNQPLFNEQIVPAKFDLKKEIMEYQKGSKERQRAKSNNASSKVTIERLLEGKLAATGHYGSGSKRVSKII